MALKKPLVLGADGRPEQLQAGDTLDAAVNAVVAISLTAGAGVIPPGSPVYSTGNDTIGLAQANAMATARVVGLSQAQITAFSAGIIQNNGVLALTTAEWDAITGETGGLVADQLYYVDETVAGDLTITPPAVAGQVVAPVGRGISTTEMLIMIEEPILL